MHTINPGLFAKLMRLPDAVRIDLLEFLGATPVADAQLAAMIDDMAAARRADRQTLRLGSG